MFATLCDGHVRVLMPAVVMWLTFWPEDEGPCQRSELGLLPLPVLFLALGNSVPGRHLRDRHPRRVFLIP
jgi:hypothetical protein